MNPLESNWQFTSNRSVEFYTSIAMKNSFKVRCPTSRGESGQQAMPIPRPVCLKKATPSGPPTPSPNWSPPTYEMLLRRQTESPGAEDDTSPEERERSSPQEDRDDESVAMEARSQRKRQPSEKARALPGGRVRKPYKDFFIWREHADLEAMILESGITTHDRLEEFNTLFNAINARLEETQKPVLTKMQLRVPKSNCTTDRGRTRFRTCVVLVLLARAKVSPGGVLLVHLKNLHHLLAPLSLGPQQLRQTMG
jgi:hypothetical protein